MKEKLFKYFEKLRANSTGFTMIELLIVIAILGILAVAVLSAINPIEQINRGRDTGSRSDAEQMLSAIDRFNAFQGYFPWVRSAAAADNSQTFQWINNTTWVDDGASADCEVIAKLSEGDATATDTCVGADELKTSYIERVTDSTYNGLYVYNQGQTGNSTYVCFIPKSNAFKTEATDRCTGPGLPNDIAVAVAAGLCGDGSLTDQNGDAIDEPMVCLP